MITLLPNGCAMIDRAGPEPTEPRPGLLLDRDGIVVVDTGYLGDPRGVRLVRGAAGLIAAANRAGWPVAIVTNQSGIGRGLYDWDAFAAVEAEIARRLWRRAHARVDLVLACPHHPEARPPWRHPAHPWRKPNPGMVDKAVGRLRLDRRRSWLLGDQVRDVEAAVRGGIGHAVLVTRDPRPRAAAALQANGTTIAVCRSLAEARAVLDRGP